jgi:hypothetical protein
MENKVERLRKIISALLAAGLTQNQADEETCKLTKLILDQPPTSDDNNKQKEKQNDNKNTEK